MIFGLLNDQSQKLLEKSLSMHDYDIILHVMISAYNLYTNDATAGDGFMNQIQSYSSKVPWFVQVIMKKVIILLNIYIVLRCLLINH